MPSNILAYDREDETQTIRVYLNFSGNKIYIRKVPPLREVLFSTHLEDVFIQNQEILLNAYEGIVLLLGK